jgi:replication-associated recombination protein RarA
MPEHLERRHYYQPTSRGGEQRIKDALDAAKQAKTQPRG